jgi:hypothetical protein
MTEVIMRVALRTAVFALLLGAACSGAKGTAQAAIAAADAAMATLPAEVAQVIPEQLQPLTDAVAAAKDQFGKADYAAALASAQEIPAKTAELAANVAAKKTELTSAWNELSIAMPRNLASVKAKLDQYAKTKPPKGMDAAQLADLNGSYDAQVGAWADATTAFQSGNLADAMTRAMDIKTKVTAAMTAFGLAADESQWKNDVPAPKN